VKYPPITHGLHLATDIPSDEWIAFFQQCKELAALARQRRAAKQLQEAEAEHERSPEQSASTA
jgi:hypothetical protein